MVCVRENTFIFQIFIFISPPPLLEMGVAMGVHPGVHRSRCTTTRGIFFFFFCISSRLSARISDFENILLMVHVGGVHACAAGARYATFFFTNARF